MADYTDIKREIDEKIIPNNNAQLITGEKLNDTLKDMLDAVNETKLDPSEVLGADGKLKASVLPSDVAFNEVTADKITGDQHSSIEMREAAFGEVTATVVDPSGGTASHIGSTDNHFGHGYIEELHTDKVTATTKVTAHIVETDSIQAANLTGDLFYTTADKPTYDEVIEAVDSHIFCYLLVGVDEVPADYMGQRVNEVSDMNEVFFLDFPGKKLYKVTEDDTWTVTDYDPAMVDQLHGKLDRPSLPSGDPELVTIIGDGTSGRVSIDSVKRTLVESSLPSDGMSPDAFYNLGTITADPNVTLAAGVAGYLNEYKMQFKIGSGWTPAVTFPASVVFSDTPTWEVGKTYQVSIVNNLALVAAWTE